MFTVTKEIKWDMAHRLPSYNWKCFNVHGHTYKALITIEREIQRLWIQDWMVMDFWDFKDIKDWIDENRDHSYVWRSDDEVLQFLKEKWYRTYEFSFSPTAEKMSEFLFKVVENLLSTTFKVKSVTIYETPTSFSTYTK